MTTVLAKAVADPVSPRSMADTARAETVMGGNVDKRLAQMEDQISELEAAIVSIRKQIEAARTRHRETGEYADRKWWADANFALRAKGAEHQRLLRQAARLRREQRTINDFFVEVSRDELDPEDFKEMMHMARERKRDYDAQAS